MPLIKGDSCYYTPTKCGTVSTIKLLEACGWKFTFGDRHNMDPSLGERRYMQVRDPLERWCSIYWAIERWTKSGQRPFMWEWTAASGAGSIQEFCDEYFRRRREKPYPMYTHNLWELHETCRPERVFKLEEYDELARWAGHDRTQRLPHVNRTKGRNTVRETFDLLRDDQVQLILDWARPDQEAFGYAVT